MEDLELKTTIIVPAHRESIIKAAGLIQEGDVVGMPTETVYGLAGDAKSMTALGRIFEVKNRPTSDPLIVHINLQARTLAELRALDLVNLSSYSPHALSLIQSLMERFWPGPLTLILPKHPSVPDLATAGMSSVALRMPDHPVALELIKESGRPLAAPSANRFGRISPTTADAVYDELGSQLGLIIDGGPCCIGVESTVLAVGASGEVCILRPGGVAREAIEDVVAGEVPLHRRFQPTTFASPGLSDSHYAPQRPFFMLPSAVSQLTARDYDKIRELMRQTQAGLESASPVGLLIFDENTTSAKSLFEQNLNQPTLVRSLISAKSAWPSLDEAAKNLFAEMRALDASEATVIFSEPSPQTKGLGLAVADRLRRASHRA